jgi:hypothetical protein
VWPPTMPHWLKLFRMMARKAISKSRLSWLRMQLFLINAHYSNSRTE